MLAAVILVEGVGLPRPLRGLAQCVASTRTSCGRLRAVGGHTVDIVAAISVPFCTYMLEMSHQLN